MRDLTSFPYIKFMKTTLYFIQEITVELGLGQSHGKYTTAPLAHGYGIGHGNVEKITAVTKAGVLTYSKYKYGLFCQSLWSFSL